jgi:hypothetical protein
MKSWMTCNHTIVQLADRDANFHYNVLKFHREKLPLAFPANRWKNITEMGFK